MADKVEMMNRTVLQFCIDNSISVNDLYNANKDSFVYLDSSGNIQEVDYYYSLGMLPQAGLEYIFLKNHTTPKFTGLVGSTIIDRSKSNNVYRITGTKPKMMDNGMFDPDPNNSYYLYTKITDATDVMTLANYLQKHQSESLSIQVYLPTKPSGNTSSIYNIGSGGAILYLQENPPSVVSYLGDYTKFNCYYTIYSGGTAKLSRYLPIFPNEVSDNSSPSFSPTSILGRSVEYQTYNSSSRNASFTLELHEDLTADPEYVHKIAAELQSAAYPNYVGTSVDPPEILFNFGGNNTSAGFFRIRGILDNCAVSWSAPIIDNRLSVCNISISIRETTGPYSMDEIMSMGGNRS